VQLTYFIGLDFNIRSHLNNVGTLGFIWGNSLVQLLIAWCFMRLEVSLAAYERSKICMKVNSSSTTRLYDTTPILTVFNALRKLFGLQPRNEQSRYLPESQHQNGSSYPGPLPMNYSHWNGPQPYYAGRLSLLNIIIWILLIVWDRTTDSSRTTCTKFTHGRSGKSG